jgi:hypothetical protein
MNTNRARTGGTMKFRATIETPSRSYAVEFDLDDETASQARLSDVLADVSKRFLRKGERAEKPAAVARAAAHTSTAPAGGAK